MGPNKGEGIMGRGSFVAGFVLIASLGSACNCGGSSGGSDASGQLDSGNDGGYDGGNGGADAGALPDLLLKLVSIQPAFSIQNFQWNGQRITDEKETTGAITTLSVPGDNYYAPSMIPISPGYHFVNAYVSALTATPMADEVTAQLAKGAVITGLDIQASYWTLVSARPATDGGPVPYSGGLQSAASKAALDQAIATEGDNGRVVTALATTTAGYQYVAEGRAGSGAKYLVQTAKVPAAGLNTAANGIAGQGYVITAFAYDGNGYTIIGTKLQGATKTYSVQVSSVNVNDFASTTGNMASSGYAIVGVAYDGASYTIVAQK
jgi:hypothetical protein